MKRMFLACLNLLFYFLALSQYQQKALGGRELVPTTTERISVSVTIYLGANKPETLRKNSIYCDSVFSYEKKEKNKDSSLQFVQYFDSLGNTVEKDEFSKEGSLNSVTNFTYDDGLLFKKEMVYRSGQREITVYDYDSSGNNTDEKFYSKMNSSSTISLVRARHREYDEYHHMIREDVANSSGEISSYTEYSYNDIGQLSETRTFNHDKTLLNSYLHEYIKKKNSESTFLTNSSYDKKLIREFFFDENHRSVKTYYYLENRSFLDHSTEYFFYNPDGLLEEQILEGIGGAHNYYFKYFYTIAHTSIGIAKHQ